jgi:AcrR family transcriptional regulator
VKKPRTYVSPKREAQAAETRAAILEAFVEQISGPGRQTLSPSDAARRAGVSIRTVHTHFPNLESQIIGLGDWFDRHLYPNGVAVAAGPEDLPRYFREIHANALSSPLSRLLAMSTSTVWKAVRQKRRTARLDAIRAAVKAIGAPARATEDTTAMLLSLSGADASWPMHDLYDLPIERIPDVIANTVALLVEQLRARAAKHEPQRAKHPVNGRRRDGIGERNRGARRVPGSSA